MGKPAARLTDPTAHGGLVTGPGVPTVLIGKMPAATMGDMHVCPMVTPGVPPIPHVGGPIVLGSMGVMIGKKPAARMGDMAICVGPPATVIMGCPTVLIGETGSGSGGGAGSAAAAAGASPPAPGSVEPLEAKDKQSGTENHFCRFQFTDAAEKPLLGVPCTWKDLDGTERESASDPDGFVQASGFAQAGSFKGAVSGLRNARWSKDKAKPGEKVKLEADADDMPDGTPVVLTISETVGDAMGRLVRRLEAKVSGGKVKADWDGDEAGEEVEDAEEAPDPETEPDFKTFRFTAFAGPMLSVSDKLDFVDKLGIELVDEKDEPVPGAEYKLFLSNGEVKEGKLDDKGKAEFEELPASVHKVLFPGLEPGEDDPPKPSIYVLEMEDVLFRHDSAIFMPNAVEDTAAAPHGQETISGLAVLKTAFLRLQEFPEQALLISGHTDTSGGPAYNLKLSDQRARAVQYMLEGGDAGRALWAGIADKKHKVEDVQHLLKWAAEVRGWDCDPGDIDGDYGSGSKKAMENFKTAYNLEFAPPVKVNNKADLDFWGSAFDVQQSELAAIMITDADGLAAHRAHLRFMDPERKAVGCGENWPIEAAEKDNFRSQTNRRVELLFFDHGEKPKLDCHSPDGKCDKAKCPLYPAAPGTRTYLPVHVHPRPQSMPTFFTKEQPGADNFVRMHTLTAYMALFDEAGNLESARRFQFKEGRLADSITGDVISIDCNREAYFYFSHRKDLHVDRDKNFKRDGSGLPLLGPIHIPCGQNAKIELDIWQQKDWVIVRGVRVDGSRPDRIRMGEWKEDYETGRHAVDIKDGTQWYVTHGNYRDKDSQETWKGGFPIELSDLGKPGGNTLWAGTLSALPSQKAKILLAHSGPSGERVYVGSFNEVAPTGENQDLKAHHIYDKDLVQKLLAIPAHKQPASAVDALPNPPARALLPGDMCWQDQGRTNNCGPFSFSTAMNYWFPYTNNPVRKDGKLYAQPGNVDDTINGARTPKDIVNAAAKFKMNGRDNDAEHLDKARALKLIKLWIHAGVPVVFLVKEEYNLWSYHWKTLAGYDGDRFFMTNSGADQEAIKSKRRPGVQYERAPVGNDVDPEVDFYGKWKAAGGDIVDAFTSVDECTFIPLFPKDPDFGGEKAR